MSGLLRLCYIAVKSPSRAGCRVLARAGTGRGSLGDVIGMCRTVDEPVNSAPIGYFITPR